MFPEMFALFIIQSRWKRPPHLLCLVNPSFDLYSSIQIGQLSVSEYLVVEIFASYNVV